MGKCIVVIDFGLGKTKISAYEKKGNKRILTTGAIIESEEGGISSPELLQSISSFLLKMKAGAGDLILILPDNTDSVFSMMTDFPIGSQKEVDGMIKNNLPGMLPEAGDKYYPSWRFVRSNADGLGEFQIAAVKKECMENINTVASQYKLNLKSADIVSNAVENLSLMLLKSNKLVLKSTNEAVAVVEVGYKSARVVVMNKDMIIATKSFLHDLYRMDKLISENLGDLKQDRNIVPEYLKMNPSFTLKVRQYQNFLQSITSDIIMQIKRSVSGENNYKLTGIYFAGGMYKMPQLVSTVKESFSVPCYAYPLQDFVEITHGCILRENNKPYPSEDVFAASVGALYGGI